MIKHLLLFTIAAALALASGAQTQVVEAKQIKAVDSLKLKDKWVKSLVVDTILANSSNRDIPSVEAIKHYVLNRFAYAVKVGDTVGMLAGYGRYGHIVKYVDTVIQMSGYLRKNFALLLQDTTAVFSVRPLNNRFLDSISTIRALANSKGIGGNYIDNQTGQNLSIQTAKFRISDTAWANVLRATSNVHTDSIRSGTTLSLSGDLKLQNDKSLIIGKSGGGIGTGVLRISPLDTVYVSNATMPNVMDGSVNKFITAGFRQEMPNNASGVVALMGQVLKFTDTSSVFSNFVRTYGNQTISGKKTLNDTLFSNVIKTAGPLLVGPYGRFWESGSEGFILSSVGVRYRATQTGDNSFAVETWNGAQSRFYIGIAGTYAARVGINTETPAYGLDVNGTMGVSGAATFNGGLTASIANGTGDFVTTTAAGLLQRRTAAQTLTDIGALSTTDTTAVFSTFVRTYGAQSIAGAKTFTAPAVFSSTLTAAGALNGGTATFTGNLTTGPTIRANGAIAEIILNATTAGLRAGLITEANGIQRWGAGMSFGAADEAYSIYNYNIGARAFTLSQSTSAATFAGTISASILNGTGDFVTTTAGGLLQRRTAVQTRSDIGALATVDTSSMLSGYGRSGHVVKYTDTSAMLSGYARTGNISGGGGGSDKLNISDTAAMLSGYVKKAGADTLTGDKVFTKDILIWKSVVPIRIGNGPSNHYSNIAFGAQALNNSSLTGTHNVAIATNALYSLTGANSENVAIGQSALFSLGGAGGGGNTAIGGGAGFYNTGGQQNTFIGYQAGFTNLGTRNVMIGYEAGYDYTGSDKVYISGSRARNLIIGDFLTGQVQINAPQVPAWTASAAFEILHTSKGFLKPRLTTAQRDAITSVAAGLEIYNSSINKMQYYDGTTWKTQFPEPVGTSSQALMADGSVIEALSTSTANAIVRRDASGGFEAGTIAGGQFIKNTLLPDNALMANGGDRIVKSGTFTPTATAVSGTSAFTVSDVNYIRIHNVVTVSGRINLTATTSSVNSFNLSIPISSAFTAENQACGTAVSTVSLPGIPARIFAISGVSNLVRFEFQNETGTNHTFSFIFTYSVI